MIRGATRRLHDPATPQPRALQLLRSALLAVMRGLSALGGALQRSTPTAARAAEAGALAPMAEGTQRLLRQAIESTLLPTLVGRQRHAPPTWDKQAMELARLLLAARVQAATDLIRDAHGVAGSLVQLLSALVEPAARKMGDLWRDDECSETDVTLGLSRLLTAVRGLDIDRPAPSIPRPCVALLAPQPGEAHVLCSALHADLAWQAGWEARVEFPESDDALLALLASRHVDLLDLSLSAAFRRDHWVERMATTVALARCASLNVDLVVVVSGRLFLEDSARAHHPVRADAIGGSAHQFARLLAQSAIVPAAADCRSRP